MFFTICFTFSNLFVHKSFDKYLQSIGKKVIVLSYSCKIYTKIFTILFTNTVGHLFDFGQNEKMTKTVKLL